MAQPIYKMFLVRPTESFYALSQAEQEKLLTEVRSLLDKVGGRSIILCDSAWASEQWTFFGVEEFPSLEALQQHTKLLEALNWYRYIESTTLLGTQSNAP